MDGMAAKANAGLRLRQREEWFAALYCALLYR